MCVGAPGRPEASQWRSSTLQGMSENPLLGLTRHGDKGFKVIETERSPIAPRAATCWIARPDLSTIRHQMPRRKMNSGIPLLPPIIARTVLS